MSKQYIFLFFCIFLAFSCNKNKKVAIIPNVQIKLNDNWTFRKAGTNEWMPAQVPGNVISDLLNNEKIDDPFFQNNEKALEWIEKETWEYRTSFDAPLDVQKNDMVSLHFAGLDTYADVFLNEQLVLKADNMFRSWDVPCNGRLKERGNTLRVIFHPVVDEGMKKLRKLPYSLPAANENAPVGERTSIYTRKAAFQYGWDMAPRLLTCGIWRAVTLNAWSNAKISDIYLYPQNISKELADYLTFVEIQTTKEGDYELTLNIDNETVKAPVKVHLKLGKNIEKFNFQITNPNLWWCNGMGTHYLYTLQAELSKDNNLIADKTEKFGVRKLELVQEPDPTGRSFFFRLNGVPIFMKGANYIPPDVLTTRVSGERYSELISSVAESNMNMLRIWGGGIYENDSLYNECDRNGILVWQDFMFTSGLQPGDSTHLDNIRKEIAENIKRLRNHPCMALWCGNSKNLAFWGKMGWRNLFSKTIADQIWNNYQRIFYDIIPSAINTYSPHIPYWASSPSAYGDMPSDTTSGDWNDWSVWYGTEPFSAYTNRQSGRFVSEYGMQSFPYLRTLKSFAGDETLNPRSPIVEARQRSRMPWISSRTNGNQMIINYIQMYYNMPADFESFVYLSQVMQADALKTAIEAHRLQRPHCMGSLYWHLNDCWPTISWSTIDYFGNWKPAQYSVKRAFANISVIPRLEGDKVKVYIASDSLATVDATLKLQVIDFNGRELWSSSKPTVIKPNTSELLWSGNLGRICPEDQKIRAFLVASILTTQKTISDNLLYFIEPQYLDLPLVNIKYTITGQVNRFEMDISSSNLAKNVVLVTRLNDAHFSDNNFDLLPGQPRHVTIAYPGTKAELQNEIQLFTLVNSY
ncbi:MAG: glycoside hydrolase family 2 protein [Bacteroidota bacterium]|nr:glycoside hydrolase family 2 protein [Bacteroidota bacterium]